MLPGAARIEERRGAAVEAGLGGADRHDEIGLDERGVEADGRARRR